MADDCVSDKSVIVVAYATAAIDLTWVPDHAHVVVVHNDDTLRDDGSAHPNVTHIRPGENLGFGAGVNLALTEVTSARVVLCNPDMALKRAHWDALDGSCDEIVTVPLVDDGGRSTSVVAPYWTPTSLLVTGFRLGHRFAPLGSARRTLASRLGGGWARRQHEAMHGDVCRWPLRERWVSGALLSIDTARLRDVGGFDESFFLYFEDTDLCQRLADRFEDMTVRVADVEPATHAVGGTATASSDVVEQIRRRSAWKYAARQQHWSWLPYRLLGSTPPR